MPQIVEEQRVYGGWYRLDRLTLSWLDGTTFERHLLDNGSAVAVLPYDIERKCCLLVSQPRAPVIAAGCPPLLEAIAGNLDGRSPETQTRIEAFEEAGVVLEKMEPIANIWSLCPVSSERIQLYLAKYTLADRQGTGGGRRDENEWITVHEIALDELYAMTRAGRLTDAKTLILVQSLMLRYPEL